MSMKIKVLVIDDSVVIRKVLQEIIDEQPDMMVVGGAPDPVEAREMIRTLNPDVLTLDVEMPKMNGLAFLRRLMRVRPMPVVMLSSYTREGTDLAFRALSLGALDFVGKPIAGQAGSEDYARVIVEKVRAAFAARDKIKAPAEAGESADADDAADAGLVLENKADNARKLVFMAGSTGGPEVLQHILQRMPPETCPGILVVQQLPAGFAEMFAKRLDDLCAVSVTLARNEEPILPGHVYIAPGDSHLSIESHGARGYGIKLTKDAPVNQLRPSADVLFKSAAALGADAIGIILTGTGADGAEGLLAMKKAGGFTIAQDEETSVVFEMPKKAISLGAAAEVLPLKMISRRVLAHLGYVRGNTAPAR